jgi:hypothetical protein
MHPVAGQQQPVMLGHGKLMMIHPKMVLQPQRAQQDMAPVGMRMGVIHGDLRQTIAAQMPRPAVAHMQHMRPAPATPIR